MTSESREFPSPWCVYSESQSPRELLNDEDERALKAQHALETEKKENSSQSSSNCYAAVFPRALAIADAIDGNDPWQNLQAESAISTYESGRRAQAMAEAANTEAVMPQNADDGFSAASNCTLRLGSDALAEHAVPNFRSALVLESRERKAKDAAGKDPWHRHDNCTASYALSNASNFTVLGSEPAQRDPWAAAHNITQLYGSTANAMQVDSVANAVNADAELANERAPLFQMMQGLRHELVPEKNDPWKGHTQKFGTGCL